MGIRFSLAGNAGERGYQAQVERAIEAEELGYEGIFLSESLMSGLDPFQVLTATALRTERIKLGTAIMTMTFREPVVPTKGDAQRDFPRPGDSRSGRRDGPTRWRARRCRLSGSPQACA
jgi:hypothetical protein